MASRGIMRTVCRYLFCGLAIVSFAVFIVTLLPNIRLSENAIQFVTYTALISVVLLALLWLAKQLWLARDVIGRILIGLVLITMVILIVTIPELQELVLSWLQGLTERPLVVTVLCLIICGFCSSRPAPQSKT